MAMKIDAGEVKRGEFFMVEPEQVLFDDVNENRWEKHTDDDVMKLVHSYEMIVEGKPQGQLVPCEVRKVEGHKLKLVWGFRRLLAAIKYNDLHPDNKMKIKVLIIDGSDEKLLIQNIVENLERKACSAMDDAFYHNKLRTVHGWTDAKICELYKKNITYVCNVKKFLEFPHDIQKLIHSGDLTVQAAVALYDVPVEDRAKVLADAFKPEEPCQGPISVITTTMPPELQKRKPGRKPSASKKIVVAARKHNIANGGRRVALNVSDVIKYFEEMTGPAELKSIRAYHEKLIDYAKGKIDDTDLVDYVSAAFVSDDQWIDPASTSQ